MKLSEIKIITLAQQKAEDTEYMIKLMRRPYLLERTADSLSGTQMNPEQLFKVLNGREDTRMRTVKEQRAMAKIRTLSERKEFRPDSSSL
jgi:hypothetical protein